MELYIVRHGQSEANAGLTENLDSPLTALGQQQAARTAERLRSERLTRSYVSPLRRTLQTIAPICAATGLRAEVYADICEYFSPNYTAFQTFQGLSPDDISREFPFTFFSDTFPCSAAWWPQSIENDQLMYARAIRVRDALLELYAATDERLLMVSHAETVGRLIEAFLHVPPNPEDPPWSDNCAISRLTCTNDPGQPALLDYQNDATHLQGLQ